MPPALRGAAAGGEAAAVERRLTGLLNRWVGHRRGGGGGGTPLQRTPGDRQTGPLHSDRRDHPHCCLPCHAHPSTSPPPPLPFPIADPRRLAESNLQSICTQVADLYTSAGRRLVSDSVARQLVAACAEGPRASEAFAAVGGVVV